MAGRKKHRRNAAVRYGGKFQRIKPAQPAEFDPAVALDMLLSGLARPRGLEALGECHDCGRPVSGERRYCGPCLAKH